MLQNATSCGIRKRGKSLIQLSWRKVNHLVKYCDAASFGKLIFQLQFLATPGAVSRLIATHQLYPAGCQSLLNLGNVSAVACLHGDQHMHT